MPPVEKRGFPICDYCKKYILFTAADHYYSNYSCGLKAREAKVYDGPVSLLVVGI